MATNVEIITIGDEILIGQIVDTNSAWMATELNKFGFEIAQISSVHDTAEHILESLSFALERADIVLLTGGIGPTKDDITKQTLCKFFNSDLTFDENVFKHIEKLFESRGYVMNELTRNQALVPNNCTVIQNNAGTAPITWFDVNGKVVVSMPGVPHEMMTAMTNDILPLLNKKFKTPTIIHKTVQVYGWGESALAIKIADWENSLPSNIKLAYLPNSGIVKLRLSGIDADANGLENEMKERFVALEHLLGDSIVSHQDVPVEEFVGEMLVQKSKTVSTAESCTGGNIAHLFTSVAGSSEFFKGSVVAYSNEIKTKVLVVSENDLLEYGAVSQQVVEQMAVGVRQLMDTDYAIATSGIAGPGGGTDEKPVGTVWIAVSGDGFLVSKEFRFGTMRNQNIARFTQSALLMLNAYL